MHLRFCSQCQQKKEKKKREKKTGSMLEITAAAPLQSALTLSHNLRTAENTKGLYKISRKRGGCRRRREGRRGKACRDRHYGFVQSAKCQNKPLERVKQECALYFVLFFFLFVEGLFKVDTRLKQKMECQMFS